MGIAKCVCGRNTDFGTLCVFCSRDKLLDRDYNEDEATIPCTSELSPEEELDEEKE